MFTEKIVATEAGNQAVLREGLMAICRPMLRSLFVCEWHQSCLLQQKMDTLLFHSLHSFTLYSWLS